MLIMRLELFSPLRILERSPENTGFCFIRMRRKLLARSKQKSRSLKLICCQLPATSFTLLRVLGYYTSAREQSFSRLYMARGMKAAAGRELKMWLRLLVWEKQLRSQARI